MDLGLILVTFAIGFILGLLKLIPPSWRRLASIITGAGLSFLLFAMGMRIGTNHELLLNLDTIGLQAFVIACGSIAGSLLLLKAVRPGNSKSMKDIAGPAISAETINKPGKGSKMAGFSFTLLMVLLLLLGVFVGYLCSGIHWLASILDDIILYALALLLLGVGIDVGRRREIFRDIRAIGVRIVLIPFVIAVGSIGGALISGLFLGISGPEAAAVGAGFGWYSLSGVILAGLHSLELGTLAFLANVIREVIAIVSLPLIVRYLGKWAAIAPGGATTMDVSLPFIKKAAGEEVVIPAFISGVILSLLVPVLVPLLIRL